LTKDERYFFEPKLPNVEVKIISTPEEFEQLDSNGYDFKMMHFKDKLEKGCLAFCAFANKELAHVTWAALSEKAKKEIDYLPFGVAFQNKEACSGASFTDPKYRGKGLFSYVYAVIFPYLAQRGIVKDKFTIEVSNISSQKAHAKFNPNITGKGHYLKILWWKFWREEPIKELKEI
jgi:GNAT superfamily N-acetyltransferase